MNRNDLYQIDEAVYRRIQEEKQKKEAATKAYFEGMEQGAEMMRKAVNEYLMREEVKLNKMKGGAE